MASPRPSAADGSRMLLRGIGVGAVVVGAIALVVNLLTGAGFVLGLTWQITLWSAVLALVAGVVAHRPSSLGGWVLLAGGTAVIAISALWDAAFWTADVSREPQLVARLLAAVGYPLIGVGALRFARAQSGGGDWGPVVDSALVTVALTVVLSEMTLARHTISTASEQVEMVGLFVMAASASWIAGMTIRLLLAGGYRALSGWALFVASVLGLAGSASFAWLGYVDGRPSTTTLGLWGVTLLLLGIAAVHPSMRALTEVADVDAASVRARVVLTAGALMVPPITILLRATIAGEVAVIAATASMVLAVLVVLRLGALIREREQALRAVRHRASHDPLTGLPNRSLLMRRLKEALREGPVGDRSTAVLFIDLDGFKAVNDTWGHAVGDGVLRTVAARLRESCRPDDTVARISGDEFTMILPGASRTATEDRAASLRRRLAEPIHLAETELVVSASIGIAVDEGTARTPDQLLNAADQAMYVDKLCSRAANPAAGLRGHRDAGDVPSR